MAKTRRIAGLTLALAGGFVLRSRLLNWGATATEATRPLPGDEFVEARSSTMAVTIAAPRSDVWPWLVQMGTHRAGWYSIDRLDNGGRPSAEHVVDDWQGTSAGDRMDSSGDRRTWFDVARIDPERALVLRARIDLRRGRSVPADVELPAAHIASSWAFVLEDGALPGTTRLLVRTRGAGHPRPLTSAADLMFWNPAHVVMQLTQFARLKRRAEHRAGGAAELDGLLPDWDGVVVARRIVEAPADAVWRALLETDLIEAGAGDPLLRATFGLRGLADVLVRRLRREDPPPIPSAMRIGELPENGPDWVKLAQCPGSELVLGAAGRFWGGRVLWEPMDATRFRTFAAPQRARIAAGFTVRALGPDRSLLRYEARTAATDAVARRRFRRYWRVVYPGVWLVMDRTAGWIADAAQAAATATDAPTSPTGAYSRPVLPGGSRSRVARPVAAT